MASIYTFLGPEGTFTEAALLQVADAAGSVRIPAPNVNIALEKVRTGEADAAMVPIENSVEGGVSATLDAIATGEPLGITGEKLVPIRFVLVARPGLALGTSRWYPPTRMPGRSASSGATGTFPRLNTCPAPRPLRRPWACWPITARTTPPSVPRWWPRSAG
jgi:hypothetical protein